MDGANHRTAGGKVEKSILNQPLAALADFRCVNSLISQRGNTTGLIVVVLLRPRMNGSFEGGNVFAANGLCRIAFSRGRSAMPPLRLRRAAFRLRIQLS